MRLIEPGYLLVTLAFIACCTTFASAEDLIQDKSLRKNPQRELTDESRRNLKGSIDEVADDEERLNFESISKAFSKVPESKSPNWSKKTVNNVRAFFGLQEKPQSWYKKLWLKLRALVGLKKKSGLRKEFEDVETWTRRAVGLKQKSRLYKFIDKLKAQ